MPPSLKLAVLAALTALGVAAVMPAFSAAAGGNAAVTFTIDVAAGHRAISPLIYGINDDATSYGNSFGADVHAADPTVVRMGGNRFTALNWTDGYSNAGADYCFENDNYMDPNSSAPGGAVAATIEQDERAGRTTIVTIPINGYVAADDNTQPPATSTGFDTGCPQDIRNSPDYMSTRLDREEPIGPKQATPSKGSIVYQNQFIDWLAKHFPHAKLIFSLDNEPDYWAGTHPEVHPAAVTYAELVKDDISYAKAIKSILPDAEVTGPTLGGWDGEQTLDEPAGYSSTDYTRYGNFDDYYLKSIAQANRTARSKLISDFDVHWYPQPESNGDFQIFSDDVSSAVAAEREQRPRSLWDPSYVEHSYITQPYSQSGEDEGPIDLIPRIQAEIAKHNRGMALNFSEWDYGASGAISGAIADADALGIFGRYGVHLATFWPQGPLAGSYAAAAFRIFRDYNGKGSSFGDTELKAQTSHVAETSVYASISGDRTKRLVIVAINKNTVPESTTIRLTHGPRYGTATVYQLTAGGGPVIRRAGSVAPLRADVYRDQLPAQSVSVLVLIVR